VSTTRSTDLHRQPAQTWALEPVTGTLRELVDNPDQIDGRARQLAQQHNRRATTTTVWHWRSNGRLHAAISVTGTKQPNQLADTWAQATGSRLNPWPNDEPFPPSDNPEPVHQAHIRWRGFVGRDSLRGNPLETIEAITRTLPEGCWVAMSVRRTHRYEKNAAIAWIRMHYTSLGDPSRQLGAHPLTASAITATIYVGAPDKPAADSIIAAISGALPGTNYEMKSRTVKDRGLRTGGLIAATTAAASATLSATTSWWPTTPAEHRARGHRDRCRPRAHRTPVPVRPETQPVPTPHRQPDRPRTGRHMVAERAQSEPQPGSEDGAHHPLAAPVQCARHPTCRSSRIRDPHHPAGQHCRTVSVDVETGPTSDARHSQLPVRVRRLRHPGRDPRTRRLRRGDGLR
jgi:hypothetical protein